MTENRLLNEIVTYVGTNVYFQMFLSLERLWTNWTLFTANGAMCEKMAPLLNNVERE